MIRPSPQYNVQNEALFRQDAEQRDLFNVKTNRAVSSFLMLNDDGSPYEITLVAGVLTATAV